MKSNSQPRDLIEMRWDGSVELNLKPFPKACLLAANEFSESLVFNKLIVKLLRADCRYFMLYGNAAEKLHEKVDEIIDELEWGPKGVLTAVHSDEPIDDVAWFFVNAAVPGEVCVQYCLGFVENIEFSDLFRAARNEVQRFNEMLG